VNLRETIEWMKTPIGSWEGLVSYAAELRPGQWAIVQEWLNEVVLTPR